MELKDLNTVDLCNADEVRPHDKRRATVVSIKAPNSRTLILTLFVGCDGSVTAALNFNIQRTLTKRRLKEHFRALERAELFLLRNNLIKEDA